MITLGPLELFILFFVTLGPLKLVGPFVHATGAVDAKTASSIAIRAFALATICVLAAGFGGSLILAKWHVSMGAMTLAGGLIFLLVALRQVLEQYDPLPAPPPVAPPTSPMASAMRLTFPLIVPPYGIAAVIILFAAAWSGTRLEIIVAMLVLVMGLNLLAMLFARTLMLHGPVALVLRVVGAVLGVLQVALAVQIMLRALREFGVPLP